MEEQQLSPLHRDNSHIQKATMPTPMAETLGTGPLPFGALYERWILDLYNKRLESCYLGGKSGTPFLHLPHCLCLCTGGLSEIWENDISFEVVVAEAWIQSQGMGKFFSCTEPFVCNESAAEQTPAGPQGWSRGDALCAVLFSLKCASWFIALTPSPLGFHRPMGDWEEDWMHAGAKFSPIRAVCSCCPISITKAVRSCTTEYTEKMYLASSVLQHFLKGMDTGVS